MKTSLTPTFALILISIFVCSSVQAQPGQKLDYPTLGISLTIPDGYQYQEGDGALVIVNQQMPNTMFVVSMHEYSTLQEIKAAANQPYTEEDGTYLSLSGSIDDIGSDAVGAVFEGYAAGYPAKAYMLGKINPHGSGITVMGVAANDATPVSTLKDVVLRINSGIAVRQREVGNIVNEWTETVTNTRLTWRSNYSSPSYTDDGISGYSSSSETYDICGQGYFTYSGSSSVSVGANDLSVLGNSNSSNQGNGTWKIDVDAEGTPLLVLKHHNGNTESFTLYYESGYLYMNDYKYTIGRGAEYGPACY